jgi:hypothetical protein
MIKLPANSKYPVQVPRHGAFLIYALTAHDNYGTRYFYVDATKPIGSGSDFVYTEMIYTDSQALLSTLTLDEAQCVWRALVRRGWVRKTD